MSNPERKQTTSRSANDQVNRIEDVLQSWRSDNPLEKDGCDKATDSTSVD